MGGVDGQPQNADTDSARDEIHVQKRTDRAGLKSETKRGLENNWAAECWKRKTGVLVAVAGRVIDDLRRVSNS